MRENKLKAIEAEIAGERAEGLARSGSRLRSALDALHRFDSGAGKAPVSRDRLVEMAAHACWAYVVQRELIGLHDLEYIKTEYAVPAEVWRRMGAQRRS
jgi:hypothetical protein